MGSAAPNGLPLLGSTCTVVGVRRFGLSGMVGGRSGVDAPVDILDINHWTDHMNLMIHVSICDTHHDLPVVYGTLVDVEYIRREEVRISNSLTLAESRAYKLPLAYTFGIRPNIACSLQQFVALQGRLGVH